MLLRKILCFAAGAAVFLAVGCQQKQKPVDTSGFKNALDSYYQEHPVCAWQTPKQFPVDLPEKGADPVEEQQLDALASAGMLQKKRTEKEEHEGRHRRRVRVTEYDLSDQGKSAWKTEQGQAGTGNFCAGSPHVTSIDNFGAAPDTSHYNVSFHFTLANPPNWIHSQPVQAAFPNLAAVASGRNLAGLAKLTKTDHGWAASGVQPIDIAPAPQ